MYVLKHVLGVDTVQISEMREHWWMADSGFTADGSSSPRAFPLSHFFYVEFGGAAFDWADFFIDDLFIYVYMNVTVCAYDTDVGAS